MATNIGNLLRCDPFYFQGNSTSTFVVDAIDKGVGMGFRAPYTGTITKIGAMISSITGSPTFDVRLETITSSNTPSGSLKTAGSNVSWSPSGTGYVWSTLGTPASVTANDNCACVINATGTASGSVKATFNVSIDPMNQKLPFKLTKTGGSWTAAGAKPIVSLQYSDGTILHGTAPITTSSNFTGASIEYAIKWTAETAATCHGAVMIMNSGNNFTVNLYEGSASTTAATTATVTGACQASGTGLVYVPFSTSYQLKPGLVYRLSMNPTGGTAFIEVQTFADAASIKAAIGDVSQSTRNGGAWTDNSTSSTCIFPVIDTVTHTGGGRGIGRGL